MLPFSRITGNVLRILQNIFFPHKMRIFIISLFVYFAIFFLIKIPFFVKFIHFIVKYRVCLSISNGYAIIWSNKHFEIIQ